MEEDKKLVKRFSSDLTLPKSKNVQIVSLRMSKRKYRSFCDGEKIILKKEKV